MASNYTEYYVQLVNARTKQWINDDTGVYCVLTAGTAVIQTIYNDDNGTAPAFTAAAGVVKTMTDGVIRFWTASTVATVDLSIVTAAGQAIFVSGLTPSQHRIEIDPEKIRQIMIVPYYNYMPTPFVSASLTATASAWGNGFSIPNNAMVHDVFLRTSVLGTTSSLNVGISGTASALIIAATTAVTGYHFVPETDLSVTITFSRGALLNAMTTNSIARTAWLNTAATAIVFKDTTATVLAAGSGWIYVIYDILPV